MTRDGNEQPVSDSINPRLDEDLHFEPVDSPPRYNSTTDKPVEYFVTFYADQYPTGLIWACDEDDAAGYEWWRALPNENAAIFWNEKLWRAKARGLTPSQALRELMAEPGTPLSGRILPESRSTAPGLPWLVDLAVRGVPLGEPVRPLGWRPDPPLDAGPAERAGAAGGWLYQVDEGHDPAGRVPVHAVAGAWRTDADGRVLDFWHNPHHGRPAPPVTAPVPPLGAGRRPAGRALLDWLEDVRAPRVCRVAGSSGSGRTHLLTWLAAACPPDNRHPDRRIQAVLPADGLTVRSATWRLAALLGVSARTPDDLVAALRDGTERTLVVTDLDRAGGGLLPDAPERIAADLLAPLSRIPWLRLVVECASGTPAAAALHAADPRAAVLDLDDPAWTDRARFAAWCADLGGTPVDADPVYPSPGLAHLAARTPADPFAAPPAAPSPTDGNGNGGGAPADRAAALAGAWWQALPGEERAAVRALVDAGRPVTLDTWAVLPGAGGPDAVRRAAARLVPPAAEGPQALWRPAPRPLADHLAAVLPPTDHAGLVRPTAEAFPALADGRPDLAQADPGLLGVLLRHAVPAGFLDQLLTNPAVLVHGEPAAVTLAFEHAYALAPAGGLPPAVVAPAEAWDLAGPACTADPTAAGRAAVLHAHLAGRDPYAADLLAALSGQAWRAEWAWRAGGGRVRHLAQGHGRHAGQLAVADGDALRFLDPRTGLPAAGPGPLPLPGGRHAGLLVADDGTVVLLGRDGAVTDLPGSTPPGGRGALATALDELTRETSHGLTAVCFADGPDGQVVATGDDDGSVVHTRTAGGRRVRRRPHVGPVTAVRLVATGGGLLQVSGGADGTVWHWYHSADNPVRVDERPHPVTAVACADTPTGLLTATAWADGLVRVRRHAGADPVDLNLGRPVHGLVATPDGRVHVALPEAVLAVRPV